MSKVAIIDYGMGNLDSVARAVEICGGEPFVAKQGEELEIATHIIIPGVGSYDKGMENLIKFGLLGPLKEQAAVKKIPLLGICLGMQLLSDKGYEGKETIGLGLINGEVKLFKAENAGERIPHMGWNEVIFKRPSRLFEGIPSGKDFYFVHSYYFACGHEENILARTPYCGGFNSAIEDDNIFGVQFHPEKSQKYGLQIIKNFLAV